ncbi:MAG: zf-HC2 domain-containing protein [Syntrophomonas sp.]
MKCPKPGQLLLYLEKELPLEENSLIESHLKTCPFCSRALEDAKQHLDFTQSRMKMLAEPEPNIPIYGQEEVWRRINRQVKTKQRGATIVKFKKIAVAAAIIIAFVLVGSNPSAQTVAANFLKVFRVQKVDTISLTPEEMASIEQALQKGNTNLKLDKFGNFETVGKAERTNIKYEDIAQLGFAAKLPENLNQAEATYYLQKSPVVTFTPNIDQVNQFLKALGSEYLLPATLDGQTMQVNAGECLETSTKDYLLLQGPTPELEAPAGVNVNEVAKAMVALPIWPENIRRQLDAVNDWEHTLLIPGENSQKVDINGKDGVLLKANHHEILCWQENGILYVLEQISTDQTDLIAIAKALR